MLSKIKDLATRVSERAKLNAIKTAINLLPIEDLQQWMYDNPEWLADMVNQVYQNYALQEGETRLGAFILSTPEGFEVVIGTLDAEDNQVRTLKRMNGKELLHPKNVDLLMDKLNAGIDEKLQELSRKKQLPQNQAPETQKALPENTEGNNQEKQPPTIGTL